MNRMLMKARFVLPVFTVVLIMALAMASTASAALPAPNFMPGFPMLAGPQVILMWSPVPGATKYIVYMNGGKVAESVAMQHLFPAPSKGGDFKFQVTAVDAVGVESPMSTEKIIKIITLEPPGGLATLPREDRIVIRWADTPGAVIYDIYRRKKGESDFKLLASITDRNYEDPSVDKGTEYEYAIKAKDSTGKTSAFSDSLQAATFIAEAADGSGRGKKRKEYKMHLLPAQLITRIGLPSYPSKAAIYGNTLIFSTGRLYIVPDITKTELLQEYQEILPDRTHFKGIAFSPDGSLIYAVEQNTSKVIVISLKTRQVVDEFSIPTPPSGPPSQYGSLWFTVANKQSKYSQRPVPYDVEVSSDGTVYVTDPSNSRIVSFSPDGEFLGTVGYNPDEGVVEFPSWAAPKATYIAIDKDGNLFTSTFSEITTFDSEGIHQPIIGSAGVNFGSFGLANGLAFDENNRLFVADSRNATIQVFEHREGEWYVPVYSFSNPEKNGAPDVASPTAIVLTEDGKGAFVVETMSKRISYLSLLWDKADPVEAE